MSDISSHASIRAPAPPARSRVFFDAVLLPHRSLGPRGFRILMLVAGGGACAIGTSFMLMGAWPVTGFCGLEILLLYIAFRLNYRSGRAYETVRLTQTDLEIRRFGPRGDEVAHWTFEPTWLRVSMDDPPRHESRLTLSSHGRSLAIGGFLTPEERLEVASALRQALHARRTAPPLGAPAG